jgi:hypothetical protein|tara:strand:+ start:1859 stop:4948 length:3090 start_codon:yes stop_codon:yes gene_type:complete
MNILGAPFASWVTKQIEDRQLSLGRGSGNNTNDLLYQQSKTPWLRLASSVNLLQNEEGGIDILKRLGGLDGININEIQKEGLAKNFILQGGAISMDGNSFRANAGLNTSNQTFNGAYGWGGTSERGLIPMPGITGASVKYMNNGALTKTEIKIKCYSKTQLALIDALYMRPGYTLLLEFGWSTYLDAGGNLQTFDSFNSPALNYLFNPEREKNHFEVTKRIQDERESKVGNYEGVYGKISNFKWTFNSDGSYDCTVYLMGMGDILESLKVNISINALDEEVGKIKGDKTKDDDDSGDIPLIANANKTSINTWLFSLYQNYKVPGRLWGDNTNDGVNDVEIKEFPLPSNEFIKTDITISKAVLILGDTSTDDDDNESPQMYITFGYLIAYIQKYILIQDTDTGIPCFSFDLKFEDLENDENYILSPPGQFSSNPLVCLIPHVRHNIPGVDVDFKDTSMDDFITKNGSDYKGGEDYNGKLSSIYVNINHIAKILQQAPRDDDNALSLLDFLKNIIGDITTSLGGINNITIKLNDDGNSARFVENTPQRFTEEPAILSEGKLCRFNTFGITPGIGGSIIRDLGIDGSISSNFASMITIGAQSNGNQISGNATSFSNYNSGIIDRIIPTKGNYDPGDEVDEDGEVVKTQEEKITASIDKMTKGGFWGWFVGDYGGVFEDVYNDRQFELQDIDSMKELHTTYINLIMGILSQPKGKGGLGQLAAPFFLPFNFNMDIDGISGIKIFQKFLIDEKILPPTYDKDSVEILVKTTDHTINKSSWITKIGTQSTPRPKKLEDVTQSPNNSSSSLTGGSSPTSQGTNTAVGNDLPPPPGPLPPEEELLRLRVTRIMDDGEQTLGIMDILAEDEQTVLFSLATSELPYKGNQNNISCVPIDNYRVQSHTSGKHGECFWLIGNEGGGYAFNKIYGNGYTRGAILIHMSPKAPGWLHGCIGPGLKFNMQNDQKGRQKGTGQNYLNPAKAQSKAAMNKLMNVLYNVGSFKLEIVNQISPLPNNFNSSVKNIASSKNLLPNPYVA